MRRALALLPLLASCAAPPPEGLKAAEDGPGPKVVFDIYHRPLPEIPLPNDYATDIDDSSPTGRRINASIEVAATQWEKRTRAELDRMTGWGTLAPITVTFSELIDLDDLIARHQRVTDLTDDAIYVVNVTEGSPDLCKPVLLDLGQGHFPTVLDRREYYPDEPHPSSEQLIFEQEEEDLDGDGELDPGEDTDMDGVLDHPNLLPGKTGKFDVMSFYERETNTLIARPIYPMREKTTYAVVLTTRFKNASGPLRSPFAAINHAQQTHFLKPLPKCLEDLKLTLDDVAFTWTFTTQAVHDDVVAVREGLYGRGSLGWLSEKFPAKINALEEGRRATSRTTNTNIVPGKDFRALGARLFEFYGGGAGAGDGTKRVLDDALSFVDFYTVGNIVSPQLFPRTDVNGRTLPLYDQVWDVRPNAGEAFTRPEEVSFFASAPTGRNGKPAPVVIFVHGHGGSKLDSLIMMGPMARFGLAVVGIDAVSHGIGIDETTQQIVNEIVKPYGLEPMTKALMKGRALDHDGDGVDDSGADYWSAYVMHTRDVVRQTAIDQMQMVRVLRSFDGVRTWDFDVNHDGQPDIAGDFDGDGKVDFGGPDVPIYLAGASLGGILSSLVGGLEPEVDAMVPILPGGYLSEIGTRSNLGQVRNAMILRMMAPLFLAQGDGALGMMVPQKHTGDATLKLADLPVLQPGSIAVARNLKTHEWRCGRVQPNGHLRVAVPSDDQDPLQLELYDEELPTRPREGCETEGFTPRKVIDTFEREVKFAGKTYPVGSKLVSLGDGYGLRRGSPDLRRLLTLAQIGLESADPANVAPNWDGTRKLVMGDGSQVATRALLVPMTGDPGVPIASAVALMRAAGLVDFQNVDARYGKTQMQELIDTGFVEGVERTGRFKNPQGQDVLMDIDVLQDVAMASDGFGVPRLNPPMRLLKNSEALGDRTVGALFPMMDPRGDHSFPVPDPDKPFDLGMLLINIFGNYLANGDVPLDKCMEDTSCAWIRPVQQ